MSNTDAISNYATATLADVPAIVDRLKALRAYTTTTGFRTTRTQNDILQALPGAVMAEVLVRLGGVK